MEVYILFIDISDSIWNLVRTWDPLARDTVGKQMIRAADGVAANLVEGDGRYGTADALHFFIIARASAREARHWLVRATARSLVTSDRSESLLKSITSATIKLNNLIRHRRTANYPNHVREDAELYDA